ncbi:MAG: endonuclease YncB(thermonuclease family) [Alphaproteobacteria bacterium]|jgi:endonuclease YncB( thermonuclease family)
MDMRYLIFIIVLLSHSHAYAKQDIIGIPTIIDGDTLKIRDQKIRLEGIDTPESNQTCTLGNQKVRCGQIAANALADKIKRATIRCEVNSIDRYERIIAECFLGDQSLNKWLVKQGYALAYKQYSKKFIPTENTAKIDQIGIWQYDFQMPWNFRSIKRKRTNLYELNYVGIEDQKIKILKTAESLNASRKEKSLLLAVASIETERMQIDYPQGDNKKGDAFNVSIYKMNKAMLRDIDPDIDFDLVHNSVEVATNYFLQGLRKWGQKKFIRYHRGGETAFNKTIVDDAVEEYVSAIYKLATKYRRNKYQLDPLTTDNMRYTIDIKPI